MTFPKFPPSGYLHAKETFSFNFNSSVSKQSVDLLEIWMPNILLWLQNLHQRLGFHALASYNITINKCYNVFSVTCISNFKTAYLNFSLQELQYLFPSPPSHIPQFTTHSHHHHLTPIPPNTPHIPPPPSHMMHHMASPSHMTHHMTSPSHMMHHMMSPSHMTRTDWDQLDYSPPRRQNSVTSWLSMSLMT